jgi:TatD DNase family protein
MIDIGVNFHSSQLKGKSDDLISKAKQAGLTGILATGTSLPSSQLAQGLAKRQPGYVWATAGVHPHSAKEWSSAVEAGLEALWKSTAVVAVGEAGLDYNRMFSPKADQQHAFERQLDGAIRTGKPPFLHCRDAFEDFRAMTRGAAAKGARGVVHCFTGTREQALAHLEDGFDIGITGWVADPARGGELRDAVKVIPLERMHLETDAPYLMPRNIPKRGPVNVPANLIWVARAIAELKGVTDVEVGRTCAENSSRMFGLQPS